MDPVFQPVLTTIVSGDLESLRSALEAEPTLVHRRSSCSHPTLLQMVACEAENLPDAVGAAAVLVNAGASLAEPLVAAASVDARPVLLYLLERGAPLDGTTSWGPLDEALYWRHLELARVLVERGAKVRSLRAAAGLGDVDGMVGFFASGGLRPEAGPIGSPFPDTVPADRANVPQDIVNNAFVMAAQNGWSACTAELLARGAQVNACPPGFHWRGTALHGAIWRGDRPIVEWLLAHGADPAVRDGMVGGDALGWAKHHQHAALIDLLTAEEGST
ncbi:MAG: ankyrin repeat domain-containing protein [Myxococcota bacterium]